MTDAPDPVRRDGDELMYRLRVRNLGPSRKRIGSGVIFVIWRRHDIDTGVWHGDRG
jgi:hypothetical protein